MSLPATAPPVYNNTDKEMPPNPEEVAKRASQVIQQKYAYFDGLVLKIVRKMCKNIGKLSEEGKTKYLYRHAYDFTPTTAMRLQLYLLERNLPYVVSSHRDAKTKKRTGHIKISWETSAMHKLKKNKQRKIHEIQSWCLKHSQKAEKYWQKRCAKRDSVRGVDDQTVIGDEMDLILRAPTRTNRLKGFFGMKL